MQRILFILLILAILLFSSFQIYSAATSSSNVDNGDGTFTFTQIVDESSTPPHYTPPSNGGGFEVYSYQNQDYGWMHNFPYYNQQNIQILSSTLTIRARDVDSEPYHGTSGEYDGISGDGIWLNPQYLQGTNGTWSITNFNVDPNSLLDGTVNIDIDIDMAQAGWATELDYSLISITYSFLDNDPPYKPELSISPSGPTYTNDNLVVTVTGPNPADPDAGDTVTYEYRWLVDVGTGNYIDDEFAGRGDHTGNTIPSSDTVDGDKWRVEVVAIDNHGARSTKNSVNFAAIGDTNTPPIANAGGDSTGVVSIPKTLDGSSSYDPDGQIVSYEWYAYINNTWILIGTDSVIPYTFSQTGSYQIKLIVFDDNGSSDDDIIYISVIDNSPPVAVVNGPYSALESETVVLDASSSYDPDGDALTYRWDFDNDGTWDTAWNTDPTISYVWYETTVQTVLVEVSDSKVSSFASTEVYIQNAPPAISAGNDKISNEGDVVTVDASFYDASPVDTHTAVVDWGDGSPVESAAVDEANEYISANHIYADNGVFTVTISVEDEEGSIAEDTLTVTVNNLPPVIEAGSDLNSFEGDTVNIEGSFTDAGVLDTHTALVDWGDGSAIEDIIVDSVNKTVPASHLYVDNGIYTVSITVTDKDGGASLDTLIVTVENLAPVVTAGADQIGDEGSSIEITASYTDAGIIDTHTALVDWGDGIIDNISVDAVSMSLIANHTYADNGEYTVVITITDNDGDSSSGSLIATVNNVAPVIDAGEDITVNEGDTTILDVTYSDAGSADTHTFAVDWGDGTTENIADISTAEHIYADNGSYTVIVTITDDDGASAEDSLVITVNNVAPIIEAGNDITTNEGDTISLDVTYSDAGSADTHTFAVDWGDGTTENIADISTAEHIYADNGEYKVIVTVTDDDGASANDSLIVTVNNVAPAVDAGADLTVDENTGITVSASYSDPGIIDTHTVVFDWGDGTIEDVGSDAEGSHIYPDNGDYSVTVTVTDKDGGVGTDSLVITVNNVKPVITKVCGPKHPVHVKECTGIKIAFTDVSPADTHTVVIDWGDGQTDEAFVKEEDGSGFAAGKHKYEKAGIYTVTITLTDDDGGEAVYEYTYIIVYDKCAGFITGGGFIDSPAGAYTKDPDYAGKLTFGFVAMYKWYSKNPYGQLYINLLDEIKCNKCCNHNNYNKFYHHYNFPKYQIKSSFISDHLHWLVIDDEKAVLEGTGKLYIFKHSKWFCRYDSIKCGFTMSIIDGDLTGGEDKIRIKIWDLKTKEVLYDNEISADQYAAPTDELEAGNVTIHKFKKCHSHYYKWEDYYKHECHKNYKGNCSKDSKNNQNKYDNKNNKRR